MRTAARVLLVEGRDDQHVVFSLANHFSIPETFQVKDVGGVEKLLETLPVQLKGSGIERVGIIVDADLNLQSRWESIRNIVQKAGYQLVPAIPDQSGTILTQPGAPVFGAWLMPDNQVAGMLEHFIAFLIPPSDVLFATAKAVVDDIASGDRRFSDGQIQKAYVHTWLAWQSDPGIPLGLAITKKFFDANAKEAQQLVEWLKKLFL